MCVCVCVCACVRACVRACVCHIMSDVVVTFFLLSRNIYHTWCDAVSVVVKSWHSHWHSNRPRADDPIATTPVEFPQRPGSSGPSHRRPHQSLAMGSSRAPRDDVNPCQMPWNRVDNASRAGREPLFGPDPRRRPVDVGWVGTTQSLASLGSTFVVQKGNEGNKATGKKVTKKVNEINHRKKSLRRKKATL